MLRFRMWAIGLLMMPIFISCRQESTVAKSGRANDWGKESLTVAHAKNFSLEQYHDHAVITVKNPWPGATQSFRYLVVPRDLETALSFSKDGYDAVVTTPIGRMVATSTTHIPALQSLGSLDLLVGFPNTQYISSLPARKLIADGKIKDLGSGEHVNMEMVMALDPDVFVGFNVDQGNGNLAFLENAGIPMVLNADWTEETPLGRAEWIKFFGILCGKEQEADSIFKEIEKEYHIAKELATAAISKPKVLSGAIYKDVWYLPAGDSWAAHFINDANGSYLFEDHRGTGSLSLSVEQVLVSAGEADVWISPAQFTTYQEMRSSSAHYQRFKAFDQKKVYTYAATKGITGGLLYYELAAHRPDFVLKDLIRILHPGLLSDHTPYFFKPLQ